MKFSIKRLPKSQAEISVEIPSENFNEYFNKAVSELGENLEVKGFRTGKAPKNIVESKVNRDRILKTAAQIAIKESYKKIVSQLTDDSKPPHHNIGSGGKLEIISQPEVEILKLAPGNPFTFKCKVSVLPEIILPDYKKIIPRAKKNEVSITEQEIEDSLVFLQKSRAKFTSLQRPAQEKDFIEIEYESPQVNSSKKITDKFILGKGRFIPGFKEKLIGMKTGEEKEFSLFFPENSFKKDLAGKEVNFKVKLKAVQKIELPEINNEFARNLGKPSTTSTQKEVLGKFDSLASLKENVREELRKEKEKEETQRLHNEILEMIAQKAKFEIPEVLIEFEKKRLLRSLKERINQNLKISFEDYLSSIKQSEEQFETSFLKEAQKRVKNLLILKEIGKREKITVAEEEAKEQLDKVLKNYQNGTEKVDVSELKEYIKEVIYNEKVLQKLGSFIN